MYNFVRQPYYLVQNEIGVGIALFYYCCCYRSFWIRGRWPKHPLGVYYRVFVGLGSDPHNNTLLRTEAIDESIMNMSIIRLSTSSDNSGEWQFSSGMK